MHEISVLVEVVRTVEEIVKEKNIKKLDSIVLEIGELSSVYSPFMVEYFPVVTDNKPFFKNTKLVIENLPGEARCQFCSEVFNVIKNKGYCPKCGSFDKDLMSGKEFNIKELIVVEDS